MRVLRLLLDFGRLEGWLQFNAATKPDLIGAEPSGVVWPREAVDLFVEAADRLGHYSMGTAVLLNEWLGQRQGDILRMPRSVIRNGNLVLRQSKGGAGVSLPVSMVGRLQVRLDAELARHIAREAFPGAVPASTIIVSEETGRSYKPDNFRHVFARCARRWPRRRPASSSST